MERRLTQFYGACIIGSSVIGAICGAVGPVEPHDGRLSQTFIGFSIGLGFGISFPLAGPILFWKLRNK